MGSCASATNYLPGNLLPDAVRPLPEEDTVRRFRPWLVRQLTDTSKEARTQLFYDELKTKFYRNNLTRRLYDLVFVAPNAPAPVVTQSYQEALDYFQQYQGKVIRSVTLRKLPLFGPTVHDTTRTATNWLGRTGNRIHFQTKGWVLDKNLLFEEGEAVEAELFYDNERLLRSLSYIRDARIRLQEVPGQPDAVDVIVITQDVFPLSVSAARGEFSSYQLEVQNNNIFGIGHRLSTGLSFREGGAPSMGYLGAYTVENMAGTFATGTLHAAYTDINKSVGLSLQRPFYTPDIRWAGGLDLQRNERLRVLPNRNPLLDTVVWWSHDWLDLWAAHAIPFRSRQAHPGGREALVLAGRALRLYHHDSPGDRMESRDFFLDRKLWLGSVGWVQRRYRRDAFIYGFGITEDVPLGSLINLTAGFEHQDRESAFVQLSSGWGTYLRRAGYVNLRLAAGQFLGGESRAERRMRYAAADWISPLLPLKRYMLRQMLHLDYMYGDRRYSYEFLSVGDREIRGIRNVFLRGTQRFSASAESIVFSPWQALGFRFAAFAFADLAYLNESPYFSLRGSAVQGYGLGLRVRNENLTFKTFQVRAAWYPGPYGGFALTIRGNPGAVFQDFRIDRPEIIPFQ
ncbi:BamA/TamA family outer membrane protein [Cesiribacter andamanensis]|uniref:hypothetical protein n=1 Tax=Cesiribacter andamanensis TaxID=649507 RepID=UPI00034533F0|nr:hypothetical protein [Cesiribacter andamanensis]